MNVAFNGLDTGDGEGRRGATGVAWLAMVQVGAPIIDGETAIVPVVVTPGDAVVIGIVLGLAAALAVAVYVTKVPVPFVNKVPQRTAEQDAAEAADQVVDEELARAPLGLERDAGEADREARSAAVVPPDPRVEPRVDEEGMAGVALEPPASLHLGDHRGVESSALRPACEVRRQFLGFAWRACRPDPRRVAGSGDRVERRRPGHDLGPRLNGSHRCRPHA